MKECRQCGAYGKPLYIIRKPGYNETSLCSINCLVDWVVEEEDAHQDEKFHSFSEEELYQRRQLHQLVDEQAPYENIRLNPPQGVRIENIPTPPPLNTWTQTTTPADVDAVTNWIINGQTATTGNTIQWNPTPDLTQDGGVFTNPTLNAADTPF